uniref:Uncharacterized protein n=1 Tax=Arundo donax TaxID=35708 RepID=A0A0A9D049_ARUDO
MLILGIAGCATLIHLRQVAIFPELTSLIKENPKKPMKGDLNCFRLLQDMEEPIKNHVLDALQEVQ